MGEIPLEVTFSDAYAAIESAGENQMGIGTLSVTGLKDAFTEWARQEGILGTLDQAAIAGDPPPLVLRAFLAGALAAAVGNGKH